ncbi:hypothetical protein D3C85_571550 [compost metagenome]
MRAERGEHAARARVHQGDAHHRVHAAQRRILDQHGEALLFQAGDTGHDARVFRQHFLRHIGQGDFAFENFALDGPLKNFRQTLHLRFDQRIAGAHAIADVQVFDQVRREIHDLAIGVPHIRQRADAALGIAGVCVDQVRAAQFAIGIVDVQAILIENLFRQRILAAWLEPALVRVVDKRRVGDVFAPELIVVEKIAIEALDELAQRRRQRAFLGRALAVGETHGRMRIADMQRPDIRDDVAPRGDFNLDAQACQQARHIGNRLFQRQVLADDIGARARGRIQGQQGLGIGVQVLHFFDHELGTRLHHFFHRATVDRAQDALAVLGRDIGRQFDLDLEDLLITVFRINNIVLRQADVFGGNIACIAIQLHEVRRAQCRRCQKVIERARRRAIAFVADGLVGDDRKIVELGFETQLVEKVDFNFHEVIQYCAYELGAIIRAFCRRAKIVHCGRAGREWPGQ